MPQSIFHPMASGDKTDLSTSVVYQNPVRTMVAGQDPVDVK